MSYIVFFLNSETQIDPNPNWKINQYINYLKVVIEECRPYYFHPYCKLLFVFNTQFKALCLVKLWAICVVIWYVMIICLLFKGTAIDLFDRYQDVENFILRGKSKISVDEVAILNKNQIVTSHEDGVVRVWDSKTG